MNKVYKTYAWSMVVEITQTENDRGYELQDLQCHFDEYKQEFYVLVFKEVQNAAEIRERKKNYIPEYPD